MTWPAAVARDFGALVDRGLLWLANRFADAGAGIAAWIRERRARRAGYSRQG